MRFKTVTAFAAIGVVLTGCAGRAPNPVPTVQPTDAFADCAAILIEAQANNQKMANLAGDQGAKTAQNVAAGVVGLFIWPVWFGMDFQGSAGIEIEALQARQQYLAAGAAQQHCTAAVPQMATQQ
jgi:hypothetical protein